MSHINKKHRHIFIHVPKTGGTSMYRQPFVGGGNHQPARELVPKHPDWFSWGFVRNPYDRLVSIYHASLQHATRWPIVDELRDFEEFVLMLAKKPMVRPHTLPMTHFLCDKNGEVLVDFVGRFETIDVDWQVVCERIGVPHVPMKHLNKTQHAPWQEIYTREMIEIVNRLYAEDFQVMCYEKVEL